MSERRENNTFWTKFVAICMLVLLLSLPIVSAAQIASVNMRGSNNISNIVAKSDTLTFNATVLHSDKPNLYNHIYVQQRLQLGTYEDPKLHTFSNCEEVENGKTVCTVTIDVENGASTLYNYQTTLYYSYPRN